MRLKLHACFLHHYHLRLLRLGRLHDYAWLGRAFWRQLVIDEGHEHFFRSFFVNEYICIHELYAILMQGYLNVEMLGQIAKYLVPIK